MYQLVRAREQSPFSERHCRALLSANAACVQRMELNQRLEGHNGCVNTVSFDTEAGNILISGSDDLQIVLWDWERGTSRLSFSSGHSNNVFQARMLPHSGGSRIVTCAADGQVRLCELPQGAGSASVSKSLLGQHYSRAHKLALDPVCPAHCFYSCGEDGLVMHYDLRCGTGTPDANTRARGGSSSSNGAQGGSSRSGGRRKLLACRGYTRAGGLTREVVGINAIHVNPVCPFHFALGAADPWARVYDVRRTGDESQDSIGPATRDQGRGRGSALSDTPVALLCPAHLAGGASPGSLLGDPHVTCVMYSKQGELLASYNDEDVYLFSAQAARGSGSVSGGGGSSSSAGARPTQQAATAAGQQQQQQQQAAPQSVKSLSPSRRPREAAGEGAAAAAAGAGSSGAAAAAAATPGVRYVLEEDEEERPRWRRRQRLVMTDNAAAASVAAAPAVDGAPASQQQHEQQQEPQREPLQLQQQQQGADLLSERDTSIAAPAQQPPDLSQPIPSSSSAGQPPTATEAPSEVAAEPAGEHTAGAEAAAPAGAEPGPPAAAGGSSLHLPQGLSGYDAVMGGRFYNPDSTSRDGVVASYYGHRNSATVKGVSFFGEDDEYVCSGSDCGHVFLWDKARGSVVWWEEGDSEVVNCLEPHPRLPLVLSTSGIDHDIKVWGPTAVGPLPPPAAALRRAMAANQRERQSTRNAYSEPEHWLLQLLAAQRRRSAAVLRRQAAAAAAAGAAAGGDGQPAAAAAEEEGATDEEGPLLLPPGGVRIVWGGGRRGGRRRGGQVEGAAGEQEEEEGGLSSSGDEGSDMDAAQDEEEGSENCQIS